MTPSNSLSSYFKDTDPVTLDNCDQEQIHLSDAIQPIGVLLVIDPTSMRIIAASENAQSILAAGSHDLLSSSVNDISTDLAEEITALTCDGQIIHEVLDYELIHHGIHYDAITHLHAERRIVEFVPNNTPSAQNVRRKMRLCSKSCARILQTGSFDEAMQIAVDAVRSITGFSRVKIYQFLPDWSGKTVAESRDGQLESYLGLHFPATDIPKQVRRIMLMMPFRAIGTISDDVIPIIASRDVSESVDLTWSLLRSVSTMHTAYCRNMAVNATFSSSLIYQGNLWGLVACHNSEALFLPFDNWSLIQEIGASLMLRYDQQQRTEVSDMIYQLRLIENQFASNVRRNGDTESVIRQLIPRLQEFLGADGFAFQYGTNLHTSGSTPPADFVKKLIQWAIAQRKSHDQYQSTELHREWEPARVHMDTACGVLIQPITIHRVCQLIWFRGPITKTVEWAGEPLNKPGADQAGLTPTLEPRSSFKRWVQTHSEQSSPWQEAELESAREIFKEFLDIIASQVLLRQENESLRDFTASAAHDIRAPLRGITMALEIMDEENFSHDTVKETHAIAQRSAKRLTDLTATLLDLALITEQDHDLEPTDLNGVLETIREMLIHDINSARATLDIDVLPVITANSSLMTRLFLNLISNSLKYAHPDRTPHIRIRSSSNENGDVLIAVTDNGTGIAQEKADAVFKPLQRLHSADEIEGTGLGLTICKKVVDVHNGSIELDTSYQNGSRFVITLPDSA